MTPEQITSLVRYWQTGHGLAADGIAGPLTLASLDGARRFLRSPLAPLSDGRRAQVTSEFRPPDRPTHNGVDLFYRWAAGDEPNFVGDRGAVGTIDGHPKWVVPYGVMAVSAAPGRVQLAGNSPTGYRVWIDHGNGMRSGYFHLLDIRVTVGQSVDVGVPLGLVGDNPSDHDGRHLHFEVSPVDRYEPTDPVPWMS